MRLRTSLRIAGSLLLLLVGIGLASAQENPLPIGVLTSRAMLANRNDVRAALELTPEQVEKVQKTVASMEGVNIGSSGASSLTAFDSSAKSIFTDQQWARLTELWIQFEGAFVLQHYEVAEGLNLSPEVRTKVGKIAEEYREWWNKEIHKVKKPGDLKRIRDAARKAAGKMHGLLDADQKKRFLEMQGPKFKFTS